MQNFFLLLLFISLFNSAFAKDLSTCYNGQLLTVFKQDKNIDKLLIMKYADNCKLINFKDYYTLRCGCFDSMKEAQKELQKYKKQYKDAFISESYTHRFEKHDTIQTKLVKVDTKSKANVKNKVDVRSYEKIISDENSSNINIKNTSPELNVIDKTITYEQAKVLFANQEYQNAYDAFYALFLNDLQNPNINFFLGRSAYMLKRFELAIASYERVLNFDDSSTRSKLEIAKCYFELKDYKKSQIIFLEAIKDNMPINVKQNINMYLSAIKSKIKKNFFYGSVVVGINYDTNIYNRAHDDIFNIPGIIDTVTNQPIKAENTTDDKSGFAHQEALSLTHMYNVSDTMKIKNDFVVFVKSIINNHKNDINFIEYSPAVSVIYDGKLLLDYALLLNKVWVGSNAFMTNYGIYPKVKYVYSSSTILGLGYKYLRKSTDTLKAENQTLEFNVRNIYSHSLMFMLYGQILTEKKLSGELSNTHFDMFNSYLSCSYRYTRNLTFTPKVQWYSKKYKDEDVFYLKKQKDNEYQLSLNSTYTYNKDILFSLDYEYIQHNSNIPSWEFTKQLITTNVIFLF